MTPNSHGGNRMSLKKALLTGVLIAAIGGGGGGGGPGGGGSQASGSGVIISKDGYVITNNHVVEGYQKLEVIFRDGKSVEATLVGTDPFADVAVLKIPGPVAGVAEFGNSDAVNPGESVIAIGSPLGDYKNTVTVGVVSATGRSIDTGYGYTIDGLIQTDGPLHPGK